MGPFGLDKPKRVAVYLRTTGFGAQPVNNTTRFGVGREKSRFTGVSESSLPEHNCENGLSLHEHAVHLKHLGVGAADVRAVHLREAADVVRIRVAAMLL